ncbi:MAG TPA: hypothetical protein VG796_03000 [Verrucomicrobiales bacterium]|nr:hypothetical protein [Verrucomicrobiales bacterium]
MRPLFILFLLCVAALPACKTTRTVVAGPQTTSLDINDYDPQAEANSAEAGMKAASMGMVGTQFGGGKGWSQRFGNADPYGYIRKDPNDPKKTVFGLNALSEKVYGGNTGTKDMKSFSQTKDFLTKRYSNTREIGQKESFSQRMSSWLSGKKANTDRLANETGQSYRDGARVLANKSNYNDGRTLPEKTSWEESRSAHTKDYYPAKKVVEEGLDKPRLLGNADKDTADKVTRFVKSRPRDNPATVDEIRQLLGKGQ